MVAYEGKNLARNAPSSIFHMEYPLQIPSYINDSHRLYTQSNRIWKIFFEKTLDSSQRRSRSISFRFVPSQSCRKRRLGPIPYYKGKHRIRTRRLGIIFQVRMRDCHKFPQLFGQSYVWRDPFRCNSCSQSSWWTSSPPAVAGYHPIGGVHIYWNDVGKIKLNSSHLGMGILRSIYHWLSGQGVCRCILPICKQSMVGFNPGWKMLKLYYIRARSNVPGTSTTSTQ